MWPTYNLIAVQNDYGLFRMIYRLSSCYTVVCIFIEYIILYEIFLYHWVRGSFLTNPCPATYGVFRKNCVFHNSLQPSLDYMAVKTFKTLNAMRVYSHSHWLLNFCTTNSSRVLARERWQTFENSRKDAIFNEHPVASAPLYWCISNQLAIYPFV